MASVGSPDSRRRRRRGAAARLILALGFTLAVPARAVAHGELRSSAPAAGDTLAAAPRELRLTFSEELELAVTRLTLEGPGGMIELRPLGLHPDSAGVLVAGIRGPLSTGAYTVRWTTAGADGHPVRGEFGFFVAPPAVTHAGPAPPGVAPPPAEHHVVASTEGDTGFDAGSPAYAAIRWLTFIGLLGVIGAVAFRAPVLWLAARAHGLASGAVDEAAARAAGVGLAALAVVGVALVLRLCAQSYALHGAARALDPALLGMMVSRTLWGWGWLLQAAATLAGVVAFALARKGRRAGWALAAAAAVGLAFTPALSGHAASARAPGLAMAADALHVLGAGGWLGSLLLLATVGIPVVRRAEWGKEALGALVNAFSPVALAFAGLVVGTGAFAAWIQLGSLEALWQSEYGRVLLLKLALLAGVFGTGAYNWLRVRPALGSDGAAGRLRRSATVELAVGVAVLAVTAVLVATATPR